MGDASVPWLRVTGLRECGRGVLLENHFTMSPTLERAPFKLSRLAVPGHERRHAMSRAHIATIRLRRDRISTDERAPCHSATY